MNYTGRVGLLCIVLGFSATSIFVLGESIKNQVFDTLVSGIIAWFIGTQYDKAKFLNKQLIEKQRDLQENKDEIESLFNNSDSFLFSNDLMNKRIMVSKGIEKLLGYSTEDFTANYNLWIEMINTTDKEIIMNFYQELSSGLPSKCELRFISKDGEEKWFAAFGNPVFDHAGKVVKLTGVASDITKRKKLEEQLKRIAYHDSLTGLPNRNLFNNYLEKYKGHSKRNHTQMAVLFMDLDGFKIINDTLGHQMGDILLKEVSHRLEKCVRIDDIVARYGGDEFIILLKDVQELRVKDVAERILDAFKEPFQLQDEACFTSPSIGISLYPQDADDSETLVKYADLAMYLAKKRGKNNYQFFIRESLDSTDMPS